MASMAKAVNGSGSLWSDFKKFILRGNIIELAVAIVIGLAFGLVVKSFVDDVIMPPIGLLLGKVDFAEKFIVLRDGAAAAGPYASLQAAKEAGAVTLRYGMFVNTVIYFLIVAFAVFMMLRIIMRLTKKEEAAVPAPTATRDCPLCLMQIPLKASRCGHCGTDVISVEGNGVRAASVT